MVRGKIEFEVIDIADLHDVLGEFLLGIDIGSYAVGQRIGKAETAGGRLTYEMEDWPAVADAACDVKT